MSKIKSITIKSSSTGRDYKISKKPVVKTNPGKHRRTA